MVFLYKLRAGVYFTRKTQLEKVVVRFSSRNFSFCVLFFSKDKKKTAFFSSNRFEAVYPLDLIYKIQPHGEFVDEMFILNFLEEKLKHANKRDSPQCYQFHKRK